MIVVVDDERTFDTNAEVIYLRSSVEALAWFAKWWTENETRPMYASPRTINELWFDHDLGEGDDASVVANFLGRISSATLNRTGKMLPIRQIKIHSQNPVGAQNLWRILTGCASHVTRTSLPALKEV